jgi:hypothetical protein
VWSKVYPKTCHDEYTDPKTSRLENFVFSIPSNNNLLVASKSYISNSIEHDPRHIKYRSQEVAPPHMIIGRLVRMAMPKSLDGLCFHNLCMLNTALCTRWLWLHKTDASKPWHGMDILVSEHPLALFHASVSILVGRGMMSMHASIPVDSVGPPSAKVCRTAASFP